MNLIHSFKWSMATEIVSKAIQPLVFIILARILTPEDFGVVSAALMVIAFSQIFWEAGMSKALIQRQTELEDAANVAFWVNVGFGMVISGLLLFTARLIGDTFFHDDRVYSVIQVMTLQVLLGSVSSVHVALLRKEMKFKKLFWIRFATVSIPGFASIPMALNGMGYWALVSGTLIGQVAQIILLWRMSHWRPKLKFPIFIAREMGRFGAWVGFSGLLAWFFVWADSLVVGMYLGSRELGLYRTGNQFAMMVFATLFSPISPVLYSHLSQMNKNKERIGNAIETIIKVIISIAIPIGMIIYSLSEPISIVLFGEKWLGVGLVIGVMALMHGFSWVVGMNGDVYRAMGKPAYEAIVTAGTLFIYLAAYIYSIKQGFEIFVWTRLLLALGALVLHLFVLRKVIQRPIMPIINYLVLITSVTGIVVMFIQWTITKYFVYPWAKIAVGGPINLIVIGLIIYVMERDRMLKDLIPLFKKKRNA